MSEQSIEKKSRSTFRQMIPGIVISLLMLLLLFRFFDWEDVLEALRHAEWIYLLLALPLYLLSYALRAFAWWTILKEAVPYWRVFLSMHIGYLLNNVLPFRLGELGRAYILGKDGLGFWRVFPSIMIERAFDMIIAVALVLGVLPFVLISSNTKQVALVVGGIVILGLLILYLLARNRQWAMAKFIKLGSRWPWILRLGENRLDAFLEGLEVLTSLGRFTKVLLSMIVSWTMAITIQYLILLAFYPEARILHAITTQGISALGVAVPSSPGYIGVFEAVIVGALALFGISFSTAFAYALTLHLMYILMTGAFGAYGLAVSRISLGEVFQNVRRINIPR
ncbi:MAG: flippase-like domain-containing protein [Anaerolineales bacterium]|nr:flippase-like domain-containing protein [Chloroflexota bacterium]MBL6981877.1 flippase-like domain-containing protein [Anaerolineales bacterium]